MTICINLKWIWVQKATWWCILGLLKHTPNIWSLSHYYYFFYFFQDERVKNSNVVNGQPNPNSIPYAPTAAEQRNLFTYKARRMNIINEPTSPYSLTPISAKSVKLLRSPRKASRKISKIPFKVLDAPELQVIVLLNFLNRA